MDRMMVAVNQALRAAGHPEFSTQALLWLGGRVDVWRLRGAVARLSQRHAILGARLIEKADAVYWHFHPGPTCTVEETNLPSAEPEAVTDHAGRLLTSWGDPRHSNPIRFHLLHRPDGRDVFLMQYSHALMDNGDAVSLVRALDRFYGSEISGTVEPTPVPPDLLAAHLQRFPLRRRLRAALRAFDRRVRRMRGTPVTLGRVADGPRAPAVFRIAARRLEAPEARALEQHLTRNYGFPSMSMAILASVFRALGQLSAEARARNRTLVAGIGIDLCPPAVVRPVFQTLASVVPLHVRAADLRDRTALVRLLNQQMREQLENDADLGTIQFASLFQASGPGVRQRITRGWTQRLLRSGYSLWYAYFGPVDAVGTHFGGAAVEEVCYTASAWPATGLTLLVNRHRGRLLFQATFIPSVVPEPLAYQFLDTILRDLVAGAGS
jgi:hypothetical protein